MLNRPIRIRPCEVCGKPSKMRVRRAKIRIGNLWFGGKWRWFCPPCAPASMNILPADIPQHIFQEYNEYGYSCHFPGCRIPAERHESK